MLVQQTVSQVQSDGRTASAQQAFAERLPASRTEFEIETIKTFFSKKKPDITESSSSARLSFDQDEHRVVVEIIDRETGDVIIRFPPEQISDHIAQVLEQTNRQTNLEDSGLIFDQTV